jgi:hypothetical protein
MARRLIQMLDNFEPPYIGFTLPGSHLREAKVYRDAEWDEYRVVFYVDGKKQMGADYHDSDRTSAIQTAGAWVTAPAAALATLNSSIADGMEYPDAEFNAWAQFRQFDVPAAMLRAMYDAQGK